MIGAEILHPALGAVEAAEHGGVAVEHLEIFLVRLLERRQYGGIVLVRGARTEHLEPGIRAALDKAGKGVADIDLYEINEAFAAQILCNIKALEIGEDNLNICGGGLALGHPIGASGARCLTTLLHQMKRTNAKTGLAALCLGGGNSVAMVVEAV